MREGEAEPRFTAADACRTATSVVMVVAGVSILARTLPSGIHVQACLVALAFIGLGGYRLSFVAAFLRRRYRALP